MCVLYMWYVVMYKSFVYVHGVCVVCVCLSYMCRIVSVYPECVVCVCSIIVVCMSVLYM